MDSSVIPAVRTSFFENRVLKTNISVPSLSFQLTVLCNVAKRYRLKPGREAASFKRTKEYWWNYTTSRIEPRFKIRQVILIPTISYFDSVHFRHANHQRTDVPPSMRP